MQTLIHKPVDITSISGYAVKMASDVQIYSFTGTQTLGAAFSITADNTATDGATIWFWFWTSLTPGSYAFNILGTVINPSLVAGHFIAYAEYFSGAWHVVAGGMQVSVKPSGGGAITTDANGDLTITGSSIINSMISPSAAIDYSKLALAGAILNSDLAGSIAYAKLVLTGSIVNSDISTSAAIDYSKLALAGAILNSDLAGSIAYSKLVLTGSIVNTDIASGAAIALSKLASLTASTILVSDESGNISSSDVTSAVVTYLANITSDVQSQLNTINSAVSTLKPQAKTYNVPLTANTTLTAVTITNIVFIDSTGGGFTVYLPLISTLVDGQIVDIHQYGANAVTIGCNASDGGFMSATNSPEASLSLSSAGTKTTLQCNAATKTWNII